MVVALSTLSTVLLVWAAVLLVLVAGLALGTRRSRRSDADKPERRSTAPDRRRGEGDRRVGLPDLRIDRLDRRSGGGDRRAGAIDRRRSFGAM